MFPSPSHPSPSSAQRRSVSPTAPGGSQHPPREREGGPQRDRINTNKRETHGTAPGHQLPPHSQPSARGPAVGKGWNWGLGGGREGKGGGWHRGAAPGGAHHDIMPLHLGLLAQQLLALQLQAAERSGGPQHPPGAGGGDPKPTAVSPLSPTPHTRLSRRRGGRGNPDSQPHAPDPPFTCHPPAPPPSPPTCGTAPAGIGTPP